MLTPHSLGQIAVPTPGTPVPLTADTTIRANKVRVAAIIGQAGRTFLGISGMNKSTGVGVVKEFWPTGAGGGVADAVEFESAGDSSHIQLSQLYVDANTANEGLTVSYWTSDVQTG